MSLAELPAKTRRQIAAEYQISPLTLRRRLQRIGISLPPGAVFPVHQKIIYEHFGYPGGVDASHFTATVLPTDREMPNTDALRKVRK